MTSDSGSRLHETTHAFELEAHPWLRPYIRERLERQVVLFADDTRSLRRQGLRYLTRRWRSVAAEGSVRGFLSPEQRGLFRETQLVMSLMEGFSDWVMDDVGAEVLPNVAIRRRFEARRGQRRRGLDRIMARSRAWTSSSNSIDAASASWPESIGRAGPLHRAPVGWSRNAPERTGDGRPGTLGRSSHTAAVPGGTT